MAVHRHHPVFAGGLASVVLVACLAGSADAARVRDRVGGPGVVGADAAPRSPRAASESGVVEPATVTARKRSSTPVVSPKPAPRLGITQPQIATTYLSRNQSARTTPIRYIILHTTEGWDYESPRDRGLRATLSYFHGNARGVSVHVVTDRYGQSGRSVPDAGKAFHAADDNTYSLGIEQIGYAAYTRAQWLARKPQLDAAAAWIAYWNAKYKIPIRRCVATRYGQVIVTGVCSHGQVEPRYRTDPGPGYPWDYVLARARLLAGSAG
jgi:N-acetyl-anhydromuramyl-L-alanine amidase AmpD